MKEAEIKAALQELIDRVGSDLRPATRFVKYDPLIQLAHIHSEYREVFEALNEHNQQAIGEELVDLQMSCETMLEMIGFNESQRRDIRRQVIEKNRVRGYYDER